MHFCHSCFSAMVSFRYVLILFFVIYLNSMLLNFHCQMTSFFSKYIFLLMINVCNEIKVRKQKYFVKVFLVSWNAPETVFHEMLGKKLSQCILALKRLKMVAKTQKYWWRWAKNGYRIWIVILTWNPLPPLGTLNFYLPLERASQMEDLNFFTLLEEGVGGRRGKGEGGNKVFSTGRMKGKSLPHWPKFTHPSPNRKNPPSWLPPQNFYLPTK